MSQGKSLAIALTLATVFGCGGGESDSETQPQATQFGPHFGPAFELPNGGYVEVKTEGIDEGGQPYLAVYFLESDVMSPMSNPPSNVSAVLNLPDGSTPEVSLSAQSDGKFVSPTGEEYGMDNLEGAIKGTLDGQAFEVEFSLR